MWYYYEVTKPFKVWSENYEVGDLIGYHKMIRLAPFYRKYYVKNLPSPIFKPISK
jgi:hypothetical protein